MDSRKNRTTYFRFIFAGMGFLLAVHAYYPAMGIVPELGNIWDVLYNAIDLMTGADPLADVENGVMDWARFLCPLSIAVVLISFFSNAVNRLLMWCGSLYREFTIKGKTFGRNSVAIYGSNDIVRSAAEGTNFIQAGDHFLKHAKSHIIIMDNDDESLSFYKRHEAELSKDTTYVGLQQISSFLMKSIPKVSYFNIYEEVARSYWREHSPRAALEASPRYDIVILGYCRDNLGYQLLKYGLLNNIFRKDQKITYHVFCKPEEVVRGFELLDLSEDKRMLGDTIVWHPDQWQRHLDILKTADRVLLCRTVNPHILNQVLLTCTTQEVYYYDPDVAAYPEKYEYKKLYAFGCTKQVLNENSILKGELHRDAMERHFQYTKKHGNKEDKDAIRKAEENGTLEQLKGDLWNDLTGLMKNSNVATSDYYAIHPVPPDLTEQELEYRAELEHIRWCRFHSLCGWQYGEPKDGKRKDTQLRIHRDLQPWKTLPESERDKNRQQVQSEQLRQRPAETA